MTFLDVFTPAEACLIGLALGGFAWVPFGRASLLLLMRKSWKRQQLRQLARVPPRPVPAVHAGQYVQAARVRAGVCGLEYPSFRRR